MNELEKLTEIISLSGVFQYGVVDTACISFSEAVRKMCEANTCRQYGKTWSCPPAIGTVDECRERCRKYQKMLVFSVKCDLEDSFDYEGMTKGMDDFKQICEKLNTEVKACLTDYLTLSNGGCGTCESCTYPVQPCRFPDKVHGSLEGHGIFVNELAKMAGINYINGPNTVTYFGAVLYNPPHGASA